MKRRHWSTKDRLALLQKHEHKCHICQMQIEPGDAWDVSHERALALLGADDDENAKPAHRKCHRIITAKVDQPTIAYAKKLEATHLGATAPSRAKIPQRKKVRTVSDKIGLPPRPNATACRRFGSE